MNLAGLAMILARLALDQAPAGRKSIIHGRRPIPFQTRKPSRIKPTPQYMNVLPTRGKWCIFPSVPTTKALDWRPYPLVCFDTFQEAYEFPKDMIPPTQGLNLRGTPRVVHCYFGERLPHRSRDDGYTVLPIRHCLNYTGLLPNVTYTSASKAEPLAGYHKRKRR